ncbi:MAG: hypothetical protein A2X94_14215 [Bdellovibrionales bacterium GWB1_55_8]|nr:MAG: hypothetical protein A2X94_14215 [Bdellovibrionales bacterium GWB1_55_8]
MSKTPGIITRTSSRRFRLILGVHVFWMIVLFFLGGWWAHLVLRQADRIAGLEKMLGLSVSASQDQWARTQRMLFWESGTFFFLLLFSTILLFWLYWRDYTRSRSLHAFFASVTHELRTPLTSIRLQAESIAENTMEDCGQRTLISRLIEDTMRLESQVERALELARIEGGGPLFLQSLQVRPWISQSLRYWGEAFSGRIEFDLQVEDIFVEADPTAIQVILKNVLENAMKHSGQDTVRMTIRSRTEKNATCLIFEDNGRGFKGDVKHLGQLFERGVSSKGTGVGLYLVRALMERMCGSAQFAHRDGFEVTLRFKGGSHG